MRSVALTRPSSFSVAAARLDEKPSLHTTITRNFVTGDRGYSPGRIGGESPFQHVAVDYGGAGDTAVCFALFYGPHIDEQRAPVQFGRGFLRSNSDQLPPGPI
jgi:hypothetical protein